MIFFRHLMGEQLDTLNLKELQHLEQQLDNSLKHIRSRKVNHFTLFLFLNCLEELKLQLDIVSNADTGSLGFNFRPREEGKLQWSNGVTHNVENLLPMMMDKANIKSF